MPATIIDGMAIFPSLILLLIAVLLTGLAVGSHTITFTSATNYDAPGDITTTITKDQPTSEAGAYTPHTGSITITITPDGANTAGAQWKIDDEATWRNSGATVTGVAVGNRVVSFKDVTNWTKPGDKPVAVTKGQTASSSYKPAILSNGVRTLVPPHIVVGTRIVVIQGAQA